MADEKKDNSKENESALLKVARTGLIMLGTAKFAKHLNKNVLKEEATLGLINFGITTALSEDDDIGGDLAAASFLTFGKVGIKQLNLINQVNPDALTKYRDVATNIQKFSNDFSVATLTIDEKYSTVMANIKSIRNQKNVVTTEIKVEDMKDDKLSPSTILNIAKGFVQDHATLLGKINSKFKSEGMSGLLQSAANTDVYEKAIEMNKNGIDASTILNASRYISGDASEDSVVTGLLKGLNITKGNEVDQLKTISKIQNVLSRDTVGSIFGSYTKSLSGKPNELNYENILRDKVDNIKEHTALVNKFLNDGAYADKDEKNYLDFMKKNGFQHVIDSSYKRADQISIGEFANHFMRKFTSDESVSNIFSKGLDRGMFKLRYAETGTDREQVSDFLNLDLIKNFSFTNVVEKDLKTGNLIDKTAFNAKIITNTALGAFENIIPAFYKVPIIGKRINTWDPASLIDSKHAISDVLMNDYKPFKVATSNRNADTFIVGNNTVDLNLIFEDIDDKNKKSFVLSTIGENVFAKVNSRKIFKDAFEEEFKTNRDNIKNTESFDDLFYRFGITNKTKGSTKIDDSERNFRNGLKQLTYSHINPLPVRYDVGKGFRYVKSSDGYYKEGHILQDFTDADFYEKTFISSVVGKIAGEDQSEQIQKIIKFLDKKKLANFSSEMIKVDNARIENLNKTAADILTADIVSSYKHGGDVILFEHGVASLNLNHIDSAFKNKFKDVLSEEQIEAISGAHFIDNVENIFEKAMENGKNAKEALSEVSKHNIIKESFENVAQLSRHLQNVGVSERTAKNYELMMKATYAKHLGSMTTKLKVIDNIDVDFTELLSNFNKKYTRKGDVSALDIFNVDFFRKKMSGDIPDEFFHKRDFANKNYVDSSYNIMMDDVMKFAEGKGVAVGDTYYKFTSLLPPEHSSKMISFLKNVKDAKQHAANAVVDRVAGGFASKENNMYKKYFEKIDLEGSNNALNKEYNIALGYEYNKITKDMDYITKDIPKIAEILSEAGKKFDVYAAYGLIKADKMAITSSDYVGGALSYITKFAGIDLQLGQKNFLGYEYYNKMATLIGESEKAAIDIKARKNHHIFSPGYLEREKPESIYQNIHVEKQTYYDLVKDYEKTKYQKVNKSYNDAIIVEDSLAKALNEKKVLDKLGTLIREIMFNNDKFYINVPEGYKTTTYFEQKRPKTNIFNLMRYSAVKGVQDSLETIGIERVPSAHFNSSPIKNYMKYRVAPLAMLASGVVALDSLVDAVIPDPVPIIGNGIFGGVASLYAGTRVGLQYGAKFTGILGLAQSINEIAPGIIDNGLTAPLDLLMDPEEMRKVYFEGKEVRINKNRFWFTSGRQSAEGEEFGQFRPSLLYLAMNRDEGIWDNKFERFAREDFLPTKILATMIDPYAEERHAYEKYGAIYPKTGQMFKDIPVIGELLSATIGQILKPTQYVNEDDWRVGENLMINPRYNAEKDSPDMMFMEFQEDTNVFERIIRAGFKAKEDLKSFAGLPGYMFGLGEKILFGSTTPYQNDIVLSSIDKDMDNTSKLTNLQLGDFFGTTEPIRRLLDSDRFGEIVINPSEQHTPDWLPEELKRGNNVYMSNAFAKNFLERGNEENPDMDQRLSRLKTVSMYAPNSGVYNEMRDGINANLSDLTHSQLGTYLSSLTYADTYGDREYRNTVDSAGETKEINLKIDTMVSPYEFISGGKRFKFEGLQQNYNEMSERLGTSEAENLMKNHINKFKQGETYKFEIGSNSAAITGMDNEGSFIYINDPTMSKQLGKDSAYNGGSGLSLFSSILFNAPMSQRVEKIFGKKSAFEEWSFENVKAPYFRDWDSPIESFISPLASLSGAGVQSAIMFKRDLDDVSSNSNSNSALLNIISKTAMFRGMASNLTDMTTSYESSSSKYQDETKIQDILEQQKYLSGQKSFYNMTNNESMSNYKKMMNDGDASYFEGLVNTRNERERTEILEQANERTATILRTVWEAQRKSLESNDSFNQEVVAVNMEFAGDSDLMNKIQNENTNEARLMIKSHFGVEYSKMDLKRKSVLNSYRGSDSLKEGKYISEKLVKRFNEMPKIHSSIYPKGTVEINSRGANNG